MFEPLKSALGKRLAELNLKGYADASEICAVANRLILEELSSVKNRFRVKFVKNGTLTIAVASSAVSQEIELKKMSILGELKKRFKTVKNFKYLTERIQADQYS